MGSQTKSPGSTKTVPKDNIYSWSNTDNIKVSDNAYATAYAVADYPSDWLVAYNFGFTIPTDAYITGVLVEIERHANNVYCHDQYLYLYNNGNIGSSRASSCSWPTSDAYASYGGATDQWGASLTPSIVNGADFGVALSVLADDSDRIFYVDHIRITVYYSYPPATPSTAPTMSPTSPTTNKRPTFSGIFSDPDGDSGYLSFEIRTASGGGGSLIASGNSNTVSNNSNASWQPSSAIPSGNYYCRYKRVDQYGLESDWSPDLSFTIQNSAPNTPSSAPTSDPASPTANRRPTFSGTFSDPDTNDSGKLTFEVRTAPSGGGTLEASGDSNSGLTEGLTGSWTPTSDLPDGTHYVRYKRVDVSGTSSGWSPDLTLVIIGSVPKELQLKWNIRSITSKVLQTYWNVKAIISKSLQTVWNVRKLAAKSVQTIWNVIAFAGKNLDLYWNIYAKYIAGIRFKQTLFKKARFRGPISSNVVFKGVQILWNIRNLANKTAQLIWNQASNIYKKVDVVWNTCINVQKNLTAKWDIFINVLKEISLAWNIRALVAKTRQLIWQIAGFTAKELTVFWNTCINATKTQTLLWNINNLASKSTQLVWNIYKVISKSIQTLWNVTSWVAREVTALWNDLVFVAKSNSFIWNVRALAIKTVQFVWNIRKIVTKTVQTVWKVSGWVYKEFSALWNIYLSAGLSRTFIWNISALVTKTRQLLWNITGWTYKAFSALWKIFSVIQFLDINNVQLPTPWLLSSTKITPNTVVSNTFKIKNNSSSSLTNAKITIHDNFNHEGLPASTTLLATGSTQLSTGTWTQVGYINGNYAYLTLGSFTSGEAKTISIKTQINQEGTFYARLHFEAMKGTTPIHADQIICVSYGTISVLKRPGEFRFKWPS